MSNNELGFAYENEVIEALKTAGIAGSITEGAGASATGADADFVLLDDDLVVHATYVAGSLGWERGEDSFTVIDAPQVDMETPADLY